LRASDVLCVHAASFPYRNTLPVLCRCSLQSVSQILFGAVRMAFFDHQFTQRIPITVEMNVAKNPTEREEIIESSRVIERDDEDARSTGRMILQELRGGESRRFFTGVSGLDLRSPAI